MKPLTRFLALVAMWAPLACACVQTQKAVVTVADVVNEVARKGDYLDAVAVAACNEAEKAALKHPDVEVAEALIKDIRVQCDLAFASVDVLEHLIKVTDGTFAKMQTGKVSAQELVNAAMAARQAFENAETINSQTKVFLEKVKQ